MPFGLLLLPTLAFVGLVTFDRALQSGIEDFGYAHRVARLRGYYFQYAPELIDYLLSVPPTQRLKIQGLRGGRWQGLLTVAGMVGVVTAVLAGSAAGLLAAVVLTTCWPRRLSPASWSPSLSWSGSCAIRPRPGRRSATRRSSLTRKHGATELLPVRERVPLSRSCREADPPWRGADGVVGSEGLQAGRQA